MTNKRAECTQCAEPKIRKHVTIPLLALAASNSAPGGFPAALEADLHRLSELVHDGVHLAGAAEHQDESRFIRSAEDSLTQTPGRRECVSRQSVITLTCPVNHFWLFRLTIQVCRWRVPGTSDQTSRRKKRRAPARVHTFKNTIKLTSSVNIGKFSISKFRDKDDDVYRNEDDILGIWHK